MPEKEESEKPRVPHITIKFKGDSKEATEAINRILDSEAFDKRILDTVKRAKLNKEI